MFWLCYQEYRGGMKRISRSWIVEADSPPDKADKNGERPYPFNGMGGFVSGGFETEEEAYEADYILWGEDE